MTKHPPGRAQFPALTAFLQGYLHEDFVSEHGTAVAAARAFVGDATPAERSALLHEWHAFLAATSAWTIAEIAALLTRELGGAWAPSSRHDLDDVVAAIAGPA